MRLIGTVTAKDTEAGHAKRQIHASLLQTRGRLLACGWKPPSQGLATQGCGGVSQRVLHVDDVRLAQMAW